MSLDQWSQTPASNDLANYFQTGMAPSKVKNAGWDVMADACTVISNGSMPTSGGTANVQTITNTRAYGALFIGMWAVFVPVATNTGAMTLQVDGLAAKNVFCNGAAAIAGQVISGIPAMCRYDGTQWQLINPQIVQASFTLTVATGLGTTPTGTINYKVFQDGKGFQVWADNSITGTGSGTTMTFTGIPAVLVHTNSKRYAVIYTDNGSVLAQWGSLDTGTSTTWTAGATSRTGGFTATSTRGITAGLFNFTGNTD